MFKENLKELRLQDNLTQGDLAEKIGVGKSTISMWESGERTPSLEMLEALADFFNVSISRLWGDEEKPVAMDGSGLSSEELEVIKQLRHLPPSSRASFLSFLKTLGFQNDAQDDPARNE